MMNTYCLKCKKLTKDLYSKGFVTKNKKYIVKAICNVCKSKNQNLFQKNKLKDSYQIYSVKYPFDIKLYKIYELL